VRGMGGGRGGWCKWPSGPSIRHRAPPAHRPEDGWTRDLVMRSGSDGDDLCLGGELDRSAGRGGRSRFDLGRSGLGPLECRRDRRQLSPVADAEKLAPDHDEDADPHDRADQAERRPGSVEPHAEPLDQACAPIVEGLEREGPAGGEILRGPAKECTRGGEPGGDLWLADREVFRGGYRLALDQGGVAEQDQGTPRFHLTNDEPGRRRCRDDGTDRHGLVFGQDPRRARATHVELVVAIPAAPAVAHLDEPGPDGRRRRVDGDRAGLYGTRDRDELVARERLVRLEGIDAPCPPGADRTTDADAGGGPDDGSDDHDALAHMSPPRRWSSASCDPASAIVPEDRRTADPVGARAAQGGRQVDLRTFADRPFPEPRKGPSIRRRRSMPARPSARKASASSGPPRAPARL